MKSFSRVSAVLTSFNPAEPQMRVDDLLARTGIPKSSGYKLVSDLIAEGLLKRETRGFVALGPSVAELLYSPLKANMPLREAYGSANARQPDSTPRKSHFESDLLELVRTERYRKSPPFTIGFANASTSHPWRLAMERSLRAAAQRHSEIVARLMVGDAQNDPEAQAGQLLEMQKEGVDICILSAAAEHHRRLEESVQHLAQQQIPVVGVDRICGGGQHLVSFVSASDEKVGRVSALWMAEYLKGRGRIVLLCGMESASPCTIRLRAARQVFAMFPEIEIVDICYTDWLAKRGYDFMENFLSSGFVPDGVWCDSGLQGIGSLNAFRDKGFRRGTIPPHTGGEMNLMYKIAATEKVPLCGLDYPPAMGAISFQVALDILFGRQVPRIVEANSEIIVTRGHETKSVRADVHAEKKVYWNRADDHVHAAGRLRGWPASKPGPASEP